MGGEGVVVGGGYGRSCGCCGYLGRAGVCLRRGQRYSERSTSTLDWGGGAGRWVDREIDRQRE